MRVEVREKRGDMMHKVFVTVWGAIAMLSAVPASAADLYFTFKGVRENYLYYGPDNLKQLEGVVSGVLHGVADDGTSTPESVTIDTLTVPLLPGMGLKGALTPVGKGNGTVTLHHGAFTDVHYNDIHFQQFFQDADGRVVELCLRCSSKSNKTSKEVTWLADTGSQPGYVVGNRSYPGATYEVRASVTPAVPEPKTWALMLLGFGVVGYGLRRRVSFRTTQIA